MIPCPLCKSPVIYGPCIGVEPYGARSIAFYQCHAPTPTGRCENTRVIESDTPMAASGDLLERIREAGAL